MQNTGQSGKSWNQHQRRLAATKLCSTCWRIAGTCATGRLQTSQRSINSPISFSRYVFKVGHRPWPANVGWRYSGRHRLFGLLYTRAMLPTVNIRWFQCQKCTIMLHVISRGSQPSLQWQLRNVSRMHSKQWTICCDICRTFPRKQRLRAHHKK